MKRIPWVALGLLAFSAPSPAPACSLCGGLMNRSTLRVQLEQAQVVAYGTIANPRFDNSPGAPAGRGATDFQVARVLKRDPSLTVPQTLTIPSYLPVLDEKAPPKFVCFWTVTGGKFQLLEARAVRSDGLLGYLDGMLALKGKDRAQALLYFARFLEHEDASIAGDAFLEFARSTDQEVAQVAPRLPADLLRRLLQNPKTPAERLGLYAFLLGSAGTEKDAELLREMILRPAERTVGALDGLLSGYIQRRPREGWDLVVALAGDSKRPFTQRFAAARTLRFFHSWKPAETRAQVLRGLEAMLPDGEVADLAVEDLRRWKVWDLTGKVLALYGRPTHDTPIVRRTVVRYALCCPLPEARRFIDDLRRRDPGLVRDLEEALE
jgi:hypothetical protein